MKINLEVNNKTNSPAEDDFFAMVAKKTIEESGYDFLRKKNISISLALVPEEEMQRLNRECRQKDAVTDVLSFFEYETIDEMKNVQEEEIFLGELILCYDDIMKYARREDILPEKELAVVVSHGVLHLLGFLHGEKMFSIQEKIINEI
jgi:probable rRNA maturation factor